MSQYPDFIGLTVEEARDILSSEYPDDKCHMIYYSPPGGRAPASGRSDCRIIRQRAADGRLELTVSPFQINE